MYFTYPCNLNQSIFLSGNVPNYSPTIHPPWHISFLVKVDNVHFNTTAPTQYQAWSTPAHACMMCGYYPFNADYTISNDKFPCPWQHTICERKRKMMCSTVRAEVKFTVWQRTVTGRNARPWCLVSKKCVVSWYMVGNDKIPLEDYVFRDKILCCLANSY
jgi:hypothetical protein